MKALVAGDPATVGRYQVFAVLGAGGMGRVLLGVSPDGRLVAVKQVHPHFAHDPGFRERFRREVTTSRMVSGAYTAAVMDADPDAPTPWLASVFVPGPALSEVVTAAGPLPPAAVRHLAAGLALALGEIHRTGLVHRDLKPGNVILAEDGPRVIDFGIARAAEGDSELTRTGSIIGSPGYMSPEQAQSKPLTPASDLFSFGALLVMAATGRGPFTGASTPQTLYNVVHAEPDLRALDPWLRRIVEPCLAKDPAHRPAPADVLRELGPIEPVASPWPPLVLQLIDEQRARISELLKPPSRRRRYAGLAAAAVVLLAAGTITVVSLTGSDSPPAAAGAPEEPVVTATNPDPFGPDNLRRVDLCRLLDGQDVPGLGRLSTKDGSALDSCFLENAEGRSLELKIGRSLLDSEAGGDLEGLPLTTKGDGRDCEAAVAVNGFPDSTLGTEVHFAVPVADACTVAKDGLGTAVRQLRAGGHDRELPPGTLAALDPCALLAPAEADRVIGPLRNTVHQGLRECRYEGTGTLSVKLGKGFPPSITRQLAGVKVSLGQKNNEEGQPGCALAWQHRQLSPREGENVELLLVPTGALTVDQACEKVQQAGQALLPRLPKP
ncbi:serine/threonine-protein kinase [Amycolatopsis sp. YIM 10]|uniref:serine/threonine-protein kinase n=1 Tax=Amycolatopsis sp. YIM 10 TaxID=2653857 RepID=UPI001290078D|nr:serine/threonine-protein kinase [Amycolatopsis sp. YIM 10]QFU90102.1 Serine/threonine-protein kinase AfsK [Amycolatopsis sp. YIM 10]